MLFWAGDTPPGFEAMMRQRGYGAREVAAARTRGQANKIIGAVLEYVRRLMAHGPWQPDVKPRG